MSNSNIGPTKGTNVKKILATAILGLSLGAACATEPPGTPCHRILPVSTDHSGDAAAEQLLNTYDTLDYVGHGSYGILFGYTGRTPWVIGYAWDEDGEVWNRADCLPGLVRAHA